MEQTSLLHWKRNFLRNIIYKVISWSEALPDVWILSIECEGSQGDLRMISHLVRGCMAAAGRRWSPDRRRVHDSDEPWFRENYCRRPFLFHLPISCQHGRAWRPLSARAVNEGIRFRRKAIRSAGKQWRCWPTFAKGQYIVKSSLQSQEI